MILPSLHPHRKWLFLQGGFGNCAYCFVSIFSTFCTFGDNFNKLGRPFSVFCYHFGKVCTDVFKGGFESGIVNILLDNIFIVCFSVGKDDNHVANTGVSVNRYPVESMDITSLSALSSSSLEIFASVVMTPIIVAILGCIIPEPFAMAPILTFCPEFQIPRQFPLKQGLWS